MTDGATSGICPPHHRPSLSFSTAVQAHVVPSSVVLLASVLKRFCWNRNFHRIWRFGSVLAFETLSDLGAQICLGRFFLFVLEQPSLLRLLVLKNYLCFLLRCCDGGWVVVLLKPARVCWFSTCGPIPRSGFTRNVHTKLVEVSVSDRWFSNVPDLFRSACSMIRVCFHSGSNMRARNGY